MKRASKFSISPSWKILFNDMNIDVTTALKLAGLPEDLFQRDNIQLVPRDFFRLLEGLEAAAGTRELGLLLAENLSTEAFDPPLFASLCSRNLNEALVRIKQYKPLIGPLVMDVAISEKHTWLTISCYGYDKAIPKSMSSVELTFYTQLARIATRHTIQPLAITTPELPNNIDAYAKYFGCNITQGEKVSICFSAQDAERPFLTSNAGMWHFFEENLNRRLKDMEASATTYERVKAALLETLPSGESAIEFIAEKLAISKRTLQRKLSEEDRNYQSILIEVRTELAEHYLKKSQLSLGEIAFMLGFRESNSFTRAYSAWKGISPGQYRELMGV